MPYLITIGGEKRNVIHHVRGDRVKVGRGMASTIHLSLEKDLYITRRAASGQGEGGERGHAQFYPENDHWYVQDMATTNGVLTVDDGQVVQLMRGGFKKLNRFEVIECGQTILLWMDVDMRPSDAFVQAASNDDATVRPSAAISHTGLPSPKSTATIDDPASEVPTLLLHDARVRAALKAHGYR